MTDVTEREPERFRRAVRAGCGEGCIFPTCEAKCDSASSEIVRAAIIAWEAPQHLQPDADRLPAAPEGWEWVWITPTGQFQLQKRL